MIDGYSQSPSGRGHEPRWRKLLEFQNIMKKVTFDKNENVFVKVLKIV